MGSDLHVQFVFQRNRPTLRPAQVHTQAGSELGSQGRYDDALDAFRAAARADAFDPQSHYEAGLTLLCLQRYTEAIESYEAAEERAPGWFHCRADLWLARELSCGRIEHEVFLGLRHLEDGSDTPGEKVRLAGQLLRVAPSVPLLHLLHGKDLAALGRENEARASYRHGLSLAEELNVKTRLLVALGTSLEPSDERTSLLGKARELNGDLVAAATAQLALMCAKA
jgi:tetratricopeptide (TPR) repeat protein